MTASTGTDQGQPVTSEPRSPAGGWLSLAEQNAWRAWLTVALKLPEQLNRDLQNDHGLALADYEILVWLSESVNHEMRMSDLAQRTTSSRSRLSHQIDRMERDGLVARRPCPSDGRGSLATLTTKGWSVLINAAPDHVDSVRRHLVDLLTPLELEQLGTICTTIANRLNATPE